MEVGNGAARTGLTIRDWLVRAREAGVGSLPGTAAEILDDDVRWVLTKGKLPAAAWIEVITTAHELGIRTTATMMYGHVDTPAHWVAHLRVIRGIQERTGGFTEFVLLPFVHANAPIYLAGLARPGPTRRENRAVHACRGSCCTARSARSSAPGSSSATTCAGHARRGRQRPGRDPDGRDHQPDGRSQNGSYKTISQIAAIAAPLGRPMRQRTTIYGESAAERLRRAASDGVCDSVRSGLPLLS